MYTQPWISLLPPRNKQGWVKYILPFLALITPKQIDLLKEEVMAFDPSFLEKV